MSWKLKYKGIKGLFSRFPKLTEWKVQVHMHARHMSTQTHTENLHTTISNEKCIK
ncbi:hypothetical protein EXN66_Car009526 [Channa argus]|uniref:Uncharacterized protein n=1 Tax=Channa argus TaxID=215402 RepID=A0A6G1PU66_CHAAH|nr:hypothetical protein EXN66_Car009526 [Channa argus]